MNTIRKILIATAFSASVAGALTGAALSGETPEIDKSASCATASWPMIPAECLEGGLGHDVRLATANLSVVDRDMQARFEIAFQ